MTNAIRIHKIGGPILFLVALLLAYIGYMQGYSADWTFDDARSLRGLNNVQGIPSAIDFITERRDISTLDRPVTMATFLLNVDDWPGHPQGFRHINTLIHLLNALLIAFAAYKIARLVPRLAPNTANFAMTLAAIWMLHPFLASASLMVIQRMTLLSGTFTLLALLAYLHGRSMIEKQPEIAFSWMTLGVGFATLVGIFAKENAALTPLLIGVLEFSVLSVYAPVKHRYLPAWKATFFLVPWVLLITFIVVDFSNLTYAYVLRSFNLGERLLSEAVILLDYVRQILLPNITVMGPYQDDTTWVRGPSLATGMATIFWLGITASAIVFRKRLPALTFAVLFFLVGHVLESSIFPLELYFEHRNYIPSLGILGAVIAVAWSYQARWPRVATVTFAAGMSVLLWQTTSLWGNPVLAAHMWEKNHPTSTRAAQTLARIYQRKGDYQTAAQIILDHYEINPQDSGLAVQTFITQCFKKDPGKRAQIIRQITNDAPKLIYAGSAVIALNSIIDISLEGKCDNYKPEEGIQIARGLLKNPGFQTPSVKYKLLLSIARAQELDGNLEAAIETQIKAFNLFPSLKISSIIFSELKKVGKIKEASEFIEQARALAPQYENNYAIWEQSLIK